MKPCPLCGGKGKLRCGVDLHGYCASVRCTQCHHRTRGYYWHEMRVKAREGAEKEWNNAWAHRRIEELEKALEEDK